MGSLTVAFQLFFVFFLFTIIIIIIRFFGFFDLFVDRVIVRRLYACWYFSFSFYFWIFCFLFSLLSCNSCSLRFSLLSAQAPSFLDCLLALHLLMHLQQPWSSSLDYVRQVPMICEKYKITYLLYCNSPLVEIGNAMSAYSYSTASYPQT